MFVPNRIVPCNNRRKVTRTLLQMADAAREQLALIDAAAAADNDLTHLFASRARFPAVFERHAELDASRRALEDQLPALAKRLGVPKLSYSSVQNQVRVSPVDSRVSFQSAPVLRNHSVCGWPRCTGCMLPTRTRLLLK